MITNHLQKDGFKVGVIVNDQGEQNIDKIFLQQEINEVLDVKNGCFCCNLSDFIDSIDSLKDKVDIILAEPSGSCTDLVATVFLPLKNLNTEIVFLPFTVIVDPKKALRIFENDDETRYLFEQQLKEADLILINKIDLYENKIIIDAKEKILQYVGQKDMIDVCSIDEKYAHLWTGYIMNMPNNSKILKDINYDKYGLAEKSLAWFDASINIENKQELDTEQLLWNIAEQFLVNLNNLKVNIEHIKIYIFSEIGTAKLSITGNSSEDIRFDKKLPFETKHFNLLISCRVKAEPLVIKDISIKILENTFKHSIMKWVKINAFSPNPPKPFVRKIL